MDPKEFVARSEACIDRVAKWLEDFDPDEVDYSAGDGALTIEFPDAARFVLSRQSATLADLAGGRRSRMAFQL